MCIKKNNTRRYESVNQPSLSNDTIRIWECSYYVTLILETKTKISNSRIAHQALWRDKITKALIENGSWFVVLKIMWWFFKINKCPIKLLQYSFVLLITKSFKGLLIVILSVAIPRYPNWMCTFHYVVLRYVSLVHISYQVVLFWPWHY